MELRKIRTVHTGNQMVCGIVSLPLPARGLVRRFGGVYIIGDGEDEEGEERNEWKHRDGRKRKFGFLFWKSCEEEVLHRTQNRASRAGRRKEKRYKREERFLSRTSTTDIAMFKLKISVAAHFAAIRCTPLLVSFLRPLSFYGNTG